jgi:glycosyltransferase involved in cell wall biosynthesis
VDRLPVKRYPKRNPNAFWSNNWFPNGLSFQKLNPDIYHFHWIGSGFVPISAMSQISQPIVWTLHDEWAFTGGCHYSGGCDRFQEQCGNCPQLNSGIEVDLSRRNWDKKRRNWEDLNIHVVTPSHWLAECAKRSSLFRGREVSVIPNGIDLNIYRPIEKATARDILNLPTSKKFILFGASGNISDTRKGFDYLLEALRKVSSNFNEEIEFLVFGASHADNIASLGVPTHFLGYLHDDVTLALMYSAANVFVAPSREDNLPNTIMESLACGTPAVAFRVGGIPDLIEHQQNGYLAAPFDTDDLAQGIEWVLEDTQRHTQLGLRARQKVENEFDVVKIAEKYRVLYHSLLDTNPP